LFAAPTIVQRMTHAAQTRTPDTRNLRTVVYGGGPLYFEDLIAAAETFGPKFAQIYGQGESPMTITAQSRELFSRALADRDDTYLKTVGRPFAGLDVDVVDTDGVSCSVGAVGEIVVAGPTVCNGYWQDEAATAATFRGGRLWTGDLGQKDARGCITLAGRSKETIITGGSNVYPIEVETVLMTHASVEEAAVTGIADPAWGEAVVAFIRLSAAAGSDAEAISAELDDHCRANIARFKCPKRYIVCDALPTNAYGKIDKRKLVAAL
ncbi:MAG: AMP-binding protein, partial [Pseudomonadota bacterium]